MSEFGMTKVVKTLSIIADLLQGKESGVIQVEGLNILTENGNLFTFYVEGGKRKNISVHFNYRSLDPSHLTLKLMMDMNAYKLLCKDTLP